ncbi:MAG TPA: L-seryl-tRNA(Sec) selenium transferase [Anaerolineae bacterium]|nr:L-seryl-tRNA(Sec) selenium transferase [Anaerolineae bacterium]
MNKYQDLPSVDALLKHSGAQKLISKAGRELVIQLIRKVLQDARVAFKHEKNLPTNDEIIQRTHELLKNWLSPTLVSVINATGVILHTNLGRAPLSQATIQAMHEITSGYSNLEFDLRKGRRGKRSIHPEQILKRLISVESALVVNNNAAAVLLVLSALARRQHVIISRTQLIEIGGGFRVPDVMRQSGAKLVSIGTTNRVHLHDYETALREPAALVLCAHHSNFRIIGFASEPPLKEITSLAHQAGIPIVHDLGSGALLDTEQYGLAHEPTVQESLKAGADIICFSGDKLLGGPQAGIIVGKAEYLSKIKKHPLARAVRADKLCLAGITATLFHYLKGEALQKLPVWHMISTTKAEINRRAQNWKKMLGAGELIKGESKVGGGSLPGESLQTTLLALSVRKPNYFMAKLRAQPAPVIARVENDLVVFDPRTVLPEQEEILIEKIRSLLNEVK